MKTILVLEDIPIYRYSKIVEELLKIIVIQSNMDYLKEFPIDNTDANSRFEYAYILKSEGNGSFRHTFPWNEITTANNV